MKGWNRIEIKKTAERPDNAWTLGYFHSTNENWDGKNRIRNFKELMKRDLALFALGDVKGKQILDIGCGTGEYMDIIAKMGGEVFGQDISKNAVDRASESLKQKGINANIKIGDAAKLLFDNNYFDAIFSADFFEHITYEQKMQVVKEIYRVLKPGGKLIIKTPNLDYLRISVLLKIIFSLLKFKSPFNIHIAHTHNNPDCQHCGLTTYRELESILFDNMFHLPKIVYGPLIRRRLPMFITKLLYQKSFFTEYIIIVARKPLFYGFYP